MIGRLKRLTRAYQVTSLSTSSRKNQNGFWAVTGTSSLQLILRRSKLASLNITADLDLGHRDGRSGDQGSKERDSEVLHGDGCCWATVILVTILLLSERLRAEEGQ